MIDADSRPTSSWVIDAGPTTALTELAHMPNYPPGGLSKRHRRSPGSQRPSPPTTATEHHGRFERRASHGKAA